MMTSNTAEKNGLERGLGLKEAVALNMIEMVGIGPFVVIPLVIKAMGGPQALLAWVAGAVLARPVVPFRVVLSLAARSYSTLKTPSRVEA